MGDACDEAVLALLGSEQRLQKPPCEIPAKEREEAQRGEKQSEIEKKTASDTGIERLERLQETDLQKTVVFYQMFLII